VLHEKRVLEKRFCVRLLAAADAARATVSNKTFIGAHFGWLCAIVFFILGTVFVNRTGIEEDEAIFASPLYRDWCFFAIPLTHGRIPIMHMSYVGALKTWLYTPIALFWQPSAAMLRIPALLVGALTIALFYQLLDSVHGRRAAFVGTILLTTDAVFLLTTVFDWGPVAIQHFLFTVILLAAVRWWQTDRDLWLFACAFCCGLAFWDKAVFVWCFAGLVAGSLLFIRAIVPRCSWKRVAIVIVGIGLGASPLIYYNLSTDPKFLTFRSNARLSTQLIGARFQILRATWNGSALFGYMVHNASDRPNPPIGALDRASFALQSTAGDRQRGCFEVALVAGLLLLPFVWRTRARSAMLFTLIAFSVAWLTMILLDGGYSSHHSILLWPLPEMFVAISVAAISEWHRWADRVVAAAVSVLVLANLLVLNQYLFQFIRNGAAGSWTDAIYPLAATLREMHPSQIALVDWGFQDPLSFLNKETPSERVIADPFMPPGESESQRKADLEILMDPNAVWVEHTPGNEFSKGINERLLQTAKKSGVEEVALGLVCDRNGRPIFQLFRFTPDRQHEQVR